MIGIILSHMSVGAQLSEQEVGHMIPGGCFTGERVASVSTHQLHPLVLTVNQYHDINHV